MRVLILALIASTSAWAAEPSDTGTIVVTAHRTPAVATRVGSAHTVIDRTAIEDRQDTVIADALRQVPGVSLARSGPFGAQTQLRMRGAEANQVLVLVDGVEANDLATNDEFSLEHMNTFDIERIEVVRGPQSALWGSDAIAGVINIITRQPTAGFDAGGFAEGGSDGFNQTGGRIGYGSERAGVLFSLSRVETDGTNAARTGSEEDGYRGTTANLTARMAAGSRLSLGLTARHVDSNSEFDAIDFVSTGLPTDAENETDAEQSYLRLGGQLDLLDGRWQQQLHYTITETETDTRTEDTATPERDFDDASVAGKRYGITWQSSFEIGGSSERVTADVFTVAVNHERQEFSQRGEVQDFFGTIYDPNQDQRIESTGYVAEYLAYLGERIALSASVRRDDNSDFDDVTTWRATASWALPSLPLRLHGSYGTGHKAPTFVERYGFYPNQFVGNPDLEPETSEGWDLGVEGRWRQDSIVADITYFRADLDNEINGFSCASFPCTAVNESGKSRRRGVEVALNLNLADTWNLAGSYTYSDSSADDPSSPEVALVSEVRRPKHTGSLGVTSNWLDNRLNLTLNAAYVGESEDVFFPPPFFFPSVRVELDGYTLLTLAGSFAVTEQVEVYARANNALDEDYEDVYGFATPGATVFAGVRLKLR
jgi:vitamin B12 transporter